MKWLFICLLTLMPGLALAQSFPALYSVAIVEPEVETAIRVAPDPQAETIGALASGARDIEVIALDDSGAWGWINSGEVSGWIRMAEMDRQHTPGNVLLPRPLICFGTEPFWNLDINAGPNVTLGRPDEAPQQFFGLWVTGSSNTPDHYALMAQNHSAQLNSVVKRVLCSDKMSNRLYGLEIDILIRTENDATFLSGCCTITPEEK